MMIKFKHIATVYFISHQVLQTNGFVQDGSFLRSNPLSQSLLQIKGQHSSKEPRGVALSMAKLWERMEIEEDPEPFWYVLNCVAGLEIDLLRQCRQRCEDMEDVEKFVVPTVTTTRSHGANRMVQDTKVKYQGYVFAKLRLCPETYEAIQELDLCRSWMGTINQKGYKKLPPAPVALNEIEIENFGLEDLEYEEPEEEVEDDNVILDSVEEDQAAAEIEEEVQRVYKGLRVEDMIKVTAKNKFYSEDGIVRRLKGGKVMIRFYTYGSMFEEWLDPEDVRKLSNEEILKGLQGPSQPITQRDIDGPKQRERPRYDDRRPGDMRRNLAGQFGSGPRDRRQDRNANRFRRDEYNRDDRKERDNWNWYKENEKRKQGGIYSDGDGLDFRGSRNTGRDWVQGDVDSQWGRTSQRQNRREKRQRQGRSAKTGSGGEDWSAFVSPASSPPTQGETDDFFASLMTELSSDLDSKGASKQEPKGSENIGSASSDEDDFFASLMSEISEDNPRQSGSNEAESSDTDDFFASLNFDLDAAGDEKSEKGSSTEVDLDDFFAELAVDTTESSDEMFEGKPRRNESPENDLDDFFNKLAMDGSPQTDIDGGDADDFFAGLESKLEAELSMEPQKTAEARVPGTKNKSRSSTTSPANDVDLKKCTVPVLKDMLRERGLKVSGKKAELIERLSA